MEANKKWSPIVTKFFSRQRTLCKKHFTCFVSQPYFKVPKTIRVDARRYFIIKIPNKRASTHFADIEFKDFVKFYGNYTKEPYPSAVNDTNFPLRLMKKVTKCN